MNKTKTLQKLKRFELLEVLLEQSKENDALRLQLEEKDKIISALEEQMQSRKLDLNKAGTIAEAAFKVNGVFQSAEKAAQQYLDNLKNLYEKEEETRKRCEDMREEILRECKNMEACARKQCEELWEQTERRCKEREKESEERCKILEEKTKENVEQRWNDLAKRIDNYYSQQKL